MSYLRCHTLGQGYIFLCFNAINYYGNKHFLFREKGDSTTYPSYSHMLNHAYRTSIFSHQVWQLHSIPINYY